MYIIWNLAARVATVTSSFLGLLVVVGRAHPLELLAGDLPAERPRDRQDARIDRRGRRALVVVGRLGPGMLVLRSVVFDHDGMRAIAGSNDGGSECAPSLTTASCLSGIAASFGKRFGGPSRTRGGRHGHVSIQARMSLAAQATRLGPTRRRGGNRPHFM